MPSNINKYETIKFEQNRKLFHLCSLTLPIIYYFIPKSYMICFMIFSTIIVLIVDLMKHQGGVITTLKDKLFINLLREREHVEPFSGASYMFLGFTLAMIISSKNLGITAWLVLIIADTVAALVGTRIGNKFDNGKSIEGSVAFLITAILVSFLSYFFIGFQTSTLAIVLGSIGATLVEFNSNVIGLNDNLTIPLFYILVTHTVNLIS